MKTITNQEHDWILAARSEGLTSLPPGVFEKDLLVTQVLHTIAGAGHIPCVETPEAWAALVRPFLKDHGA